MRFPGPSVIRRCTAFAFHASLLFCLLATADTANAESGTSTFQFRNVDDKSLGLWDGDSPVLVYRFGEMSLQGVRAAGTRSSYVHPIYGLDGELLTDDFPVDHYHHHGLFWGWPHVTIAGREYDLWKMRGIRINFQRWLAKEATTDRARLGVENGWFVRDRNVMKEEVWLEVHAATTKGRYIDVTLTWTPTEGPITLGGAEGKSYGGLSLRFAPRTTTVVTVPAGQTTEDLLITKLPWADLSGKFVSGTSDPDFSGVALLIDPRHPAFPPEWMTRDYGLLAIGWPGIQSQTLPPGKPVTLRYRLWIHRGVPSAEKIEEVYDAYTKSRE